MIELVSAGCFSHSKNEAKINQDAVLLPFSMDGGYIFGVADGVGSSYASEIASKIAINTLTNRNTISSKSDVENTFTQIKHEISTAALNNELLRELATTLTFAFVNDSGLHVGHVGDCRLYLKENGKLVQITKDHTQYQRLLDSSIYTKSELKQMGVGNTLVSALSPNMDLEFDYYFMPISKLISPNKDFVIYIMSDGAYAAWHARPRFSDATLDNPTAFCSSLLKRIKRCGAVDDHSILAVKIATRL